MVQNIITNSLPLSCTIFIPLLFLHCHFYPFLYICSRLRLDHHFIIKLVTFKWYIIHKAFIITTFKFIITFKYVPMRIRRALYAVKVRRHKPWSRVRCHGSHECWFTHSQFHSQRHSLRITLKYTTLVHMRSGYVWTMKSWQRSEWRLGFNSVLMRKAYGDSTLLVLNGTSLNSINTLLILSQWYQGTMLKIIIIIIIFGWSNLWG